MTKEGGGSLWAASKRFPAAAIFPGPNISLEPIYFNLCLGLPTVYQVHFWLSKQGSNSMRFLSMAQAT
jgi:hypothetical protein